MSGQQGAGQEAGSRHGEPQQGGVERMPALYLGHGAPPLVDDELWVSELKAWADAVPRPKQVLMVSAHWESAPLAVGATEPGVPLVYDFWGFPQKYYEAVYDAPVAPELAARVAALMPDTETVVHHPGRGLDHGAYVPLSVMYPDADVPVLQLSLPTDDPARLLELGRRLAPLRDEGVLIIGSGFMTHGLPYLEMRSPDQPAPGWSKDFDRWAEQTLQAGDLDQLMDYRHQAPAAQYAHPTADHFSPLFVVLGAAEDPTAAPKTVIEGYWFGLAKRSVQVA